MKKIKNKTKKLSSKKLQKVIKRIIWENPNKQMNPKQIQKKVASENNIDSILYALESLVKQGVIIPKDNYKFQANKTFLPEPTSSLTYEGYVDMTRSGAGFVLVDELEDDIYIPKKYMGSSMNGDRVKVALFNGGRKRRKKEGRIIKVLERATKQFVARLRVLNDVAVAFPESDALPVEIAIKKEDIREAKDGDMVIVEIVKWPNKPNRPPVGRVKSVLLANNESDKEMQSILINNGFSLSFPDAVMEQVMPMSDKIPEEEIAKRRDFRSITTLTIDPHDAKDFDDALSYEKLKNGDVEIGVHIADVTHFMAPDTPLDEEAYDRSTSVYLVDRVCPMLPEKLSNNLCSLRPNVDRLAFSAVFTFDEKMKIKKRWFGKTVIHSDKRFAYEDAQKVLDAGKGAYFTELNTLNKIAEHLRKQRFKEGSISFETDEVKFKLDENGKPIEIYLKTRKATHLLVEDFMLLANREVAEYIERKSKGGPKIPFVYRIHDLPDRDKLMDFARFAGSMGVKFDIQTPKSIVESFNKLSEQAESNPELKILVLMGVRTMAKAVYSSDNIGHYGLGFEHYTHFTSPIRRYADVLVHRLLARNLDRIYRADPKQLEQQCKHISNQERKAVDAERQSVRYKQVEYLQQFVGHSFEGLIRGIGERGFYVELIENFCDGMVSFESLGEPFFIERGRMQARGKHTGRKFKMGDHLKVIVVAVNLEKRQVEFQVEEQPKRRKSRR
ncbi:MAG TPA: ribonuclease R [Saprospiraceae bacterium]|nr:ribonuclease R [Saprospiraceae bacterium]